jgi:hypothetical protein
LVSERAPSGEIESNRAKLPGLHWDFHVIERAGACVYLYTNDSGIGVAALPKTDQGC